MAAFMVRIRSPAASVTMIVAPRTATLHVAGSIYRILGDFLNSLQFGP